MNPNYPAWLGLGLLNGIDWSASAASAMPRFLDEYTLHDSSWIGMWSEPGFESIALIGWDTHWSRGRVPYPIEGTPAGYPILLIQFERLWRQSLCFEGADALGTIGGASSRELGSDEKAGFLAQFERATERRRRGKHLEESFFHTIVSPVVGGDLELWHSGATRFLCLDALGGTLPIPDL